MYNTAILGTYHWIPINDVHTYSKLIYAYYNILYTIQKNRVPQFFFNNMVDVKYT